MKNTEVIQYIGEHLLPGKLGQFFIVLSFCTAFLACISYYFASIRKDEIISQSWKKIGRIAYTVNWAAVIGIGIVLFFLILKHYNEYNYVYNHSSKTLPIYYIVSAFWEGQEGAFWLWSFWQGMLGFILIFKAKSWENGVMTVVSLSQTILNSMILGVAIFGDRLGSSPFILLRDAVNLKETAPIFANPAVLKDYLKFITDGKGLNPLLQNYWMVIHPPTLFLGFGSMIVPFAYAITALWQKRYTEFIKPVLPWTLFAVMILGTGIIMGSFWAYEALNFGGFWAWDPVENASLIPWLILVAALHVLVSYKSSGNGFLAAIILTLSSFILVLYASFLTRSGVLGDTSVHSFTDMGMFGHLIFYILVFLCLAIVMIVIRYKDLPTSNKDEAIYSREFWMFIGATILTVSCLQVIATTSIPVFNKAFGTKWAPPIDLIGYYNKWQGPFAVLVAILAGFSQFLKYKKTNLQTFYINILKTFIISVIVTALLVYFTHTYTNLMYMFLSFACVFSIACNLPVLIKSIKGSFKLAGSAVAHIGFALLLFGAMVAAGTKKVISINHENYIAVKDFEKHDNPGENIMVYKNEPKRMGKYEVTYVSDTTIAPNTFYNLHFKEFNKKQEVVNEFNIHPNIQINDRMGGEVGLIASPDNYHALTHDIYTYVTNAPDKRSELEGHGEEGKDLYQAPKISNVKIGDTLSYAGGKILVKDIDKKPKAKDLKLGANDIAVGLKLEVQSTTKTYQVEPIYLIKGNNVFDFARTVNDLGVKFRFTNIFPEKNEFELQVFEKPQQAKDWIVFKSIEFPYILFFWTGTIIMVLGFLLSIFRRQKEIAFKGKIKTNLS